MNLKSNSPVNNAYSRITSCFVAVSLCANILLLAWLVAPVAPPSSLLVPRPSPLAPSSAALAPRPSPLAPPSAPLDTRPLTLFHWSQLESDDYRIYVANLRSIGCPKATLRDIIIPDVNAVFDQRVKELVDIVQYRFWDLLADQNAFEDMVDEKHKQLDELEKERDSVLQELLGRHADHRMQQDELAAIERTEQRKQMLDFLPASKVQQCLAVDGKFEALRDQLNYADPPLDFKDVQARSKNLQDQQRKQFEALLSSDELTEYKLRTSRFADLRSRLNGFDATETEVKEMVCSQETIAALGQPNVPQRQREALKNLIGEKRFAEYETTADNRFQEFYQVADRFELPTQAVTEAFEIRKAAEAVTQQIRNDKTIATAVRATQLAAICAETERALTKSLGQKAFETYQARSGQWLAQLVPSKPD